MESQTWLATRIGIALSSVGLVLVVVFMWLAVSSRNAAGSSATVYASLSSAAGALIVAGLTVLLFVANRELSLIAKQDLHSRRGLPVIVAANVSPCQEGSYLNPETDEYEDWVDDGQVTLEFENHGGSPIRLRRVEVIETEVHIYYDDETSGPKMSEPTYSTVMVLAASEFQRDDGGGAEVPRGKKVRFQRNQGPEATGATVAFAVKATFEDGTVVESRA